MSTRVEVLAATPDQQPILANLIELYAHDFSEFHAIELGPDGRFGYDALPLYWTEPGWRPFLVRMETKLAGFVLVKRVSKPPAAAPVWDMAEFFVARAYRRKGIGTTVAHQVWKQFPGPWEVRVMESNHRARNFWEQAITAFTGKPAQSMRFEKQGQPWQVFQFHS